MRPKFLYKYQSIDDWSLGNFRSQQIFLNYPGKFDDPYDSALNIVSITEEDILQLWDLWKEKKTLPNLDLDFETYSSHWEAEGTPSKKFILGVRKVAKEGLLQGREEVLNNWGMSCFSAVYDSILMWSHYANGHKGICVEFDASKEPFSNAFEVKYFRKIPRHNYADIIADPSPMKKISQQFLVKADCWKFQKEWRIIGPKGGIPIKYEKNSVLRVFFGIKSTPKSREETISALGIAPEQCFIMQNDDNAFKLKALMYKEREKGK